MEKSIYSREYAELLVRLRDVRQHAGLTQADIAERLGPPATQSFVSKCERGERRLDVLELRAFCLAIGVPLSSVLTDLDPKPKPNPNPPT